MPKRDPKDPSLRRLSGLGRGLVDVFARTKRRAVRGANRVDRTVTEEWRRLLGLVLFPSTIEADRQRVLERLARMTERVRGVVLQVLRDAVGRTYDDTFQAMVDGLPEDVWAILVPVVPEAVDFRGNVRAETVYDPPDEAAALAAINDTNAPDGLLWRQRLSRALPAVDADTVANLMAAGMAEGLGPRDIARQIRPFIDGYRNRAIVIARTEVLRASQVIQRRAFQPFRGVIGAWQVVSAGDDRVRPVHAERHLRIYAEPEHAHLFPGAADISERPDTPDAPQCRCVVVPILLPRTDIIALAQQRLAAR